MANWRVVLSRTSEASRQAVPCRRKPLNADPLGGITQTAGGPMSALDTIGKAALHPFLSRDLDDRLSRILIRSVTSPAWNVFALGALVSLVVLSLPLHSQ